MPGFHVALPFPQTGHGRDNRVQTGCREQKRDDTCQDNALLPGQPAAEQPDTAVRTF
ncbi:hypothetical protein PARMER_01253 [Parabacteroides merdae ATCC 43184]|nr:hypothetical protein PARMER_01253 [Parabacteroides merdae ATCC 43184]